jgi:hypothetical protein
LKTFYGRIKSKVLFFAKFFFAPCIFYFQNAYCAAIFWCKILAILLQKCQVLKKMNVPIFHFNKILSIFLDFDEIFSHFFSKQKVPLNSI